MTWISVKDRLPDREDFYGLSTTVLGWSTEGAVVTCFIGGEGKFVERIYSEGRCGQLEEEHEITHWMKLPEGPKG